MADDIVTFLRKRDYKYVRELGAGGCGKTVLLHDEIIDEQFVCKKYEPSDPGLKEELFSGFMTEIKLMYKISHRNIARIFTYHVEPKHLLGYIIMEYVEGETIDKHLRLKPESISDVFRQTVSAFSHLEKAGVLHRDIRCPNILVSKDGVVKVIDLGFGKAVRGKDDFTKSITLNWAFTPPKEFSIGIYDFRSEVYFVGKLFKHIMDEQQIEDERIEKIVRSMCSENARHRIQSFQEVALTLDKSKLHEPQFEERAILDYRLFADELDAFVGQIESSAKYATNADKVISELEEAYTSCMLETITDGFKIAECFIKGSFISGFGGGSISVAKVKNFLLLLKNSSSEGRRIVLANLFGRLDGKPRYDDEIPF